MFDTRKFGRYLSRLRKNADMTQSELADILNLTRQAISRYEIGESFPDISILILIADCFHITVDEIDWHFIGALLPYAGYLTSQIEAAVMEGALPQEALGLLHDNQ